MLAMIKGFKIARIVWSCAFAEVRPVAKLASNTHEGRETKSKAGAPRRA